MPLTKATTNVINLNEDTLINGLLIGRGNGNISFNTALGSNALLNNTTGSNNTASGSGALQNNTTGDYNTAYGRQSLQANTTAESNTAVGHAALRSNTTGNYNTAIGATALLNNTTGTANTVIGIGALITNTIGYSNTAIGTNALYTNSSGDSNTAVGSAALLAYNFNNTTGLGNLADVTGNNQVQLGNSLTTTYAYGAVQNRSDIRDKADVRDTELGLEFVNALRPVDFKWDMREDYRPKAPIAPPEDATDEQKMAYKAAKEKWLEDVKLSNITHDGSKKRNRFHHGLIAQEVKSILDSKGIDFGGFQDHKIAGGDDVLSIGYIELIAPMIKAIQELSIKVDKLESI